MSFAGPDAPPRSNASASRVQLRIFTATEDIRGGESIRTLQECRPDEQRAFRRFVADLGDQSFEFLRRRLDTRALGPVLVAAQGVRIVGAIGPLEILADRRGRLRLLPPYFAVLPEYRRRGNGRALWRAAMRWGHANGAEYLVLQTGSGGASDHLCRSEGLTSLGLVYRQSDLVC